MCFLLGLLVLHAVSAEKSRGDDLTVKIAVMGPGSELYFWWGHITLVIDDARTGQSRYYDYGLFAFTNDHFFYNFAFGRLLYYCGVTPSEGMYSVYRRTNRDITVYTLDSKLKDGIHGLKNWINMVFQVEMAWFETVEQEQVIIEIEEILKSGFWDGENWHLSNRRLSVCARKQTK